MSKLSWILITLSLLAVAGHDGYCQKNDSSLVDYPKKQLTPSVIRPVFFEFSARTLPAINFYPERKAGSEGDFEANRLLNVKLNVPVILSNRMNVIGQLRYKNERLHLGNDMDAMEKEIGFKSLGMSFLFKYELNDRYFIGGHAGGFLKADKFNFQRYSSILDYSSSFMFGKNLDLGTIGFGAVFGNSLGRFRMYPLFMLDYQLANTWRLEMRLPKEVQLRKIIVPDNFYVVAGARGNLSSYFIENDFFRDYSDLEYRRAAVDLNIGIEKEIVDMLWFGVDIGLTAPLFSALVQSGQPTREKLFDFDNSFAPYASFSIYLVPPRSLFNKMKR